MQVTKNKLFMSLFVLLMLFSFSSLMADVLVISPESATVPVKGHVQFEVHLFSESAAIKPFPRTVTWQVLPEALGKITDDGFFMAGDNPGRCVVVATMKAGGQAVRAEAKVQIGSVAAIAGHLPTLVIRPKEAALAFGDTLKFRAVLRYPTTNKEINNVMLNWTVKPKSLGKINQKGVFVAGNTMEHGKVIAYVEYMGKRIYDEAYVVVGTRPTSAISGVVMDEDNSVALENAVVIAQRIGHAHWLQQTRSDSAGNYQLGRLIPGYYVIRAIKAGFLTEFYQDVRYFEEATPVQLAENDTITNINFNLNHGGAISGTIYSSLDSSKLEDAHIYAFLKLKPERKFHTLADQDGNYTISGLHSGAYVVYVNKSGYRGEFYDDVLLQANATLVQVNDPDTTTSIDFALNMKSAIAGKVVSDVDGSPIAGAVVFAKNLNRPNWLLAPRAKTDENGEYVLQLPPAYYVVRVEADSFNGEFYNDTYDPALATPVQVQDDQHTPGIDFSLAPLSTMSGTVTDQESGDALGDAVIWAFPEMGNQKPVKTRSDENGNYELTRLHPGIYFIKAWANGYYAEYYEEARNLADAKPLNIGYNQQLTGIDFTLTKAGTISGTVISDSGGAPIPRALVSAKMKGRAFEKNVFTNDDGEYTLAGLPAGTYYVKAMAEGFYREFYDDAKNFEDATEITLGESENITGIDFGLTPAPDSQGKITGTIVADEDGLPIPGAMVVALKTGGGKPHFTVTNAEGFYALRGLPTGKYYVFTWASGYIGEFYDNVHQWKRATLVSVFSPNATHNIDFGLAKRQQGPYVIQGKILARGSQQPVANALVYAYRGKSIFGFGVTDDQGMYAITDIPAGHYQVMASAPGMNQNIDGDPNTADSLGVDLSSGQDAAQANITMDLDVSTDVSESSDVLPQSYGLEQNYPNPFNPETEIRFALPESGEVSLKIFNMLGQEITSLIQGSRLAGKYTVKWNGLNQSGMTVPSGIYFYRIQVKNSKGIVFDQVKKMTMMK